MKKIAVIAGGAAGSLAANGLLSKLPLPAAVKKYLPIVKAGVGYYMTTQKSETMKNLGMGVIAEAAVETALAFAPKTFKLAGFGDVYTAIGDPYTYDALPGAGGGVNGMGDKYTEGDELIAGAYDIDAMTT